jgi:hypothetical protein
VVRVVGIGLRHGEVRVLHALPRGVDVQPLVGRAHPVDVAEDPVAPDPVGGLVAVERARRARAAPCRRRCRRSRPDHTRPGKRHGPRLPRR